jgi:hypothetical protein
LIVGGDDPHVRPLAISVATIDTGMRGLTTRDRKPGKARLKAAPPPAEVNDANTAAEVTSAGSY